MLNEVLGWSYHTQRWSCSWQSSPSCSSFSFFSFSLILGCGTNHHPMEEPVWKWRTLEFQCWTCCSPIKWVWLNNPFCSKVQPKPGWEPVVLKQFSKTLMRQQQFLLGEKGSGISVLLMDCNYLMLSPECSLAELGFSRQSIMAVIAKGSLAGAGAARCNGTLL